MIGREPLTLMRFEARELKPFAEPVSAGELKEGSVYFFVTFLDDDMLLPMLEPVVFIGRNLEAGDSGRVYFQDVDSYRHGLSHDAADGSEQVKLLKGSDAELGNVFDFEHALEQLMACSLRRMQAHQS